MDVQHLIVTRDLYFSYSGAAPYVLSGVSLEIRDGEYVSVVGDNGSGKTTLIKLMLKLLRPTRGAVRTSAGRIGYVPQKADAAGSGFPITVYEMLNAYRRLLGIRDRSAVERALEKVGMSEHRASLMGRLSGGQHQKTLIARAIMGNPDLLILDEPSTGVDAASQGDIYGIIKRQNADEGMTIVSVEHNLQAAMSNSSLIYHLAGGHVHVCTPAQYAEEYLNISDGEGKADA